MPKRCSAYVVGALLLGLSAAGCHGRDSAPGGGDDAKTTVSAPPPAASPPPPAPAPPPPAQASPQDAPAHGDGTARGDGPPHGEGHGRPVQDFGGSWLGHWHDKGNKQRGQTMITIASDGTMSGSVTNDTHHAVGPIVGRIEDDGNFAYTYSYPGNQTYKAKGHCLIGKKGHLRCKTTTFDAAGHAFATDEMNFTRR